MTKRNNCYATLGRNGTEDEFTIHAPDGRESRLHLVLGRT